MDIHHTYTLPGPATAEWRSAPAAERWAFAGRQRELTPLLFFVASKANIARIYEQIFLLILTAAPD